jgi:transposase/predicted DNA-binding protein YlxM (UPF0122 family)
LSDAWAARYQAGESIEALAAAAGVSPRRISKALQEAGLRPIAPRRQAIARQLLVEMYVERGLSADAVANQLGCSSQKVRDDLRHHGIKLRPPGVANAGLAGLNAEVLRGLYVDERLTLSEIAERLGCSARAVANRLTTFAIAPRPRGRGPRSGEDPAIPSATLRAMYVDQARSIRAIAEALGTSSDVIRARMRAYGIEHGLREASQLAPELLRSLYLDQGQGIAEIAAALGVSQSQVRADLTRHGIHRPRGHAPKLAALDPDRLEDLYVACHLTLERVARELGCSLDRVTKGLRAAGIAIRPRKGQGNDAPRPIPRDALEDLYVTKDLSLNDVAAKLGTSADRVRDALRSFGIPIRRAGARPAAPFTMATDTLFDLFVTERLSVEEIASRHGASANQVRLLLRSLGIRRPASPPPKPTLVETPPREVLEDLYVRQGATSHEIAQQLHTSSSRVRAWLRDAGIQVKPRATRAHRQDVDADALRQLYLRQELTIAEVADRLGVTSIVVRRSLHAHGIPVRRAGARPQEGRPSESIRILDELYSDSGILALLRRHHIEPCPEAGPIAVRFPEPVAISVELLYEAYVELGLAAHQIELLTGQPAEKIRDALRAAGIPLRSGGASPWRSALQARARSS